MASRRAESAKRSSKLPTSARGTFDAADLGLLEAGGGDLVPELRREVEEGGGEPFIVATEVTRSYGLLYAGEDAGLVQPVQAHQEVQQCRES